MSARFDRKGGGWVPYLSALALLGLGDGADTDCLDLAGALRTFSVQPTDDMRELFARVVLSVAIHNTDDHLRNHGLLHQARGWRLSPLFNVNPNPSTRVSKPLRPLSDYWTARLSA